MKLVLDVADDIPLGTMQSIYDGIEKQYSEYIVEMGWVVKGKFVKQLEEKEKEIKEQPADPYDKMFGPAKGKKEDPFSNLLGLDKKKDKKDDSFGFL